MYVKEKTGKTVLSVFEREGVKGGGGMAVL